MASNHETSGSTGFLYIAPVAMEPPKQSGELRIIYFYLETLRPKTQVCARTERLSRGSGWLFLWPLQVEAWSVFAHIGLCALLSRTDAQDMASEAHDNVPHFDSFSPAISGSTPSQAPRRPSHEPDSTLKLSKCSKLSHGWSSYYVRAREQNACWERWQGATLSLRTDFDSFSPAISESTPP